MFSNCFYHRLEDHTDAKPSSYNMDKYLHYIAYVCVLVLKVEEKWEQSPLVNT